MMIRTSFVGYGGTAGNVGGAARCESWHASLSARCIEVHRYFSAQKGESLCPFDEAPFLVTVFFSVYCHCMWALYC